MSFGKPSTFCPLCQGESNFLATAGDHFYRVTDYMADLYRCGGCGAVFQHPFPKREAVPGFYPGGYWREESSPGAGARLQRKYVSYMLRLDLMKWFHRMALPAGSFHLDVGCSRGDWPALIRDAGYRVQGLETDPRAARYARDHYNLDVLEVDAASWRPEEACFDGISAFHLLEHLLEPEAFLAKCRLALRPSGKLLVRVPNIASLQSKWLGVRWKGLEAPRHIFNFTPEALGLMLERAGFRVLRRSTWALRDGPPALSSSLLPDGEPTRQQIFGRSQPLLTLVYLGLTWLVMPLEWTASAFSSGSMLTVIAQKIDA